MRYISVADCLCLSILLGVGELRKSTGVAKIPKKTSYVGSRSFKVIEFGTNQMRINDTEIVKCLWVISYMHRGQTLTDTDRHRHTLK